MRDIKAFAESANNPQIFINMEILEDLEMPYIRFHNLRHTVATNMRQLTGRFYAVGEVLKYTLAGIGV